ncbi:NAD(P)H-dependent glycerol-3-phosphate dehydrogenase [Fusobacterium sp. PH5-44]|uniref:NAD(P)H-dependent glycerol-3-phosphate dehydrogenase n=1 Tax=unclassified Fusobacterium TaxID=2648384 RepID=UPI003D198C93
MDKVVVLGAGSWGTALSIVLSKGGHEVFLWEFSKEKADEIQKTRENKKFLPSVKLPDNIHVVNDKKDLLKNIDYIVCSVPSQVLRHVIKEFSDQLTENHVIINTAKGLEMSTGLRLSEVIKEELPEKYHNNVVVLSGPTHAEEVGLGLPTVIVASGKIDVAKKVQKLFSEENFKVYVNEDIIGVELGGAVKNCLAIGAGIADGIGFGDNTKAALITRGIAEITRYGRAKGAKEITFSGLSGIGDLIVTCASKHSRNRHVGEELGRGKKLDEILAGMLMVAEGVPTVKAVYEDAKALGVSMPIIEGIYSVLYENVDGRQVVVNLMNRASKEEFY